MTFFNISVNNGVSRFFIPVISKCGLSVLYLIRDKKTVYRPHVGKLRWHT